MFSLQRKQSMTQSPVTTASTTAPPLTPHAKALFSVNPLTVLAPAPCDVTSPAYDTCADDSPTTRSSSNNEKTRSKQSSLLSANGTGARSPLPSAGTGTLKMDTALAGGSSLHQDADGSARHSLGMLKSIRSLHGDAPHHKRTIARDFTLPPTPMSSLLHENCSSLKDQFLKIKERFSAPSPAAVKSVAPPVPPLSSTAADTSVVVSADTTAVVEAINSSTASSRSCGNEANASADADNEEKSCSSSHASSSRSPAPVAVSGNGGSAVDDVQVVHGDTTGQELTAPILSGTEWPQRAQMERWYVEDNYFRGSLTCWTMDRGAAIVSRIAAVVAAAESGSTKRINPDISLQWIGRQLWAITVSLPLTRSGELKDEHIALAERIDEVIAREDCASSAPSSSEVRRSSGSSTAPVRRLEQLASGSNCDADNQVPTVVLRDPDAASNSADADCDDSSSAAVAAADGVASSAASDSEDVATAAHSQRLATVRTTESLASTRNDSVLPTVAATVSVFKAPPSTTPLAPSATPVKYSNTSVSTVAVEEEYARELEASQTSQSQSAHEDLDVVASLPLSWSMLSTTSLPESVGNSLNSNDPRDDDPRSPPEMTGWLKKKTGLNAWQQRYFELKGNRLYYFATETDGVPRGAIVLDRAHVLRGKGEQSMSFSITTTGTSLQIVKFSARMAPHVHLRKSCVLRVIYETDESVSAWVTALNRASFYCNLSGAAASASFAQMQTFASPGKTKKKVPFYRLRTSSSSSADDENKHSSSNGNDHSHNKSNSVPTLECASYHHYGSVKYLQDTDPLLWEIHPHDQVTIRKRATLARTRSDYIAILSKYSTTFRQIVLPRPRPISLEQTLRDILPELFLINNVLYGGGDENNGLENIFEVLDNAIKRFASAQDDRVRAVSTLLQACARTISGGDSYFVIHSLLGNPFMIIRPAEARGHPIEIEVSSANPCQFLITVFSAFSFHHIDDVEKYGDASDTTGGTAMTPEPLLRVKTYHIQEFDFGSGKSSRWLQIRADGMKDDAAADSAYRHTWSRRDGLDTGFGALLDPLS